MAVALVAVGPPVSTAVWWIALNEFHAVEFDIATLETAVTAGLEAAGGWANPHLSSVKKDSERCYAPTLPLSIPVAATSRTFSTVRCGSWG